MLFCSFCVNKGGVWGDRRGGGLRKINTCRKVPLQVNFFRWRHFALLSVSLRSGVSSLLPIPRSVVCQLLLTIKDFRKRIIKEPRLFCCLLKLASRINPPLHTLAHVGKAATCHYAHLCEIDGRVHCGGGRAYSYDTKIAGPSLLFFIFFQSRII